MALGAGSDLLLTSRGAPSEADVESVCQAFLSEHRLSSAEVPAPMRVEAAQGATGPSPSHRPDASVYRVKRIEHLRDVNRLPPNTTLEFGPAPTQSSCGECVTNSGCFRAGSLESRDFTTGDMTR